jgi:hypothetical protein
MPRLVKYFVIWYTSMGKQTVNINVDSEFATNTNTSASRQCRSIHESKLGDTSMPGESTNTTSSRRRGHLSVGQ